MLAYLGTGRCADPNAIPAAASELECKDGKLQGATYSDNGYVIIGMFYPVDKSIPHRQKDGDNGYGQACEVWSEPLRILFATVCALSPG